MALERMKLVNVIGLMSYLDDVAAALGQTGVFQPDETAEFYSDNENMIPVNASNEFEPLLERLKELMNGAGIRPRIVDLPEEKDLGFEEANRFVGDTARELGSLIERRDTLRREINVCTENIEKAEHFVDLTLDINKVNDCEYIFTRFGKLPKDSYIKLDNYKENPYVEFFPCSRDDLYYWGVYVVPVSEADKIDRIFSRLYFERVELDDIHDTPSNYVKQQKELKTQLDAQVRTLDKEIDDYAKRHTDDIHKIFTSLCRHHAYLSIKTHACKYRKSFVLVGWIPAEYEGQVESLLSAIESVEVTFTNAKDEIKHSPPVKLKNPFFFRPFEYYTEMYGLPNSQEIDPSGFIAITYTLLFGIMFADVGQGIMLLIAAIIMLKVKKMPLGALLIPCSICSTIFGFIFGSVFGFEELLTPVYKALFGLKDKPIHVMEGETTKMLIFGAVGIGVVLLMVAMILNIISCLKRKDIGGALFGVNGVSGLVFYTALVAGLVCTLLLGVNIMTTPYIIGLIVLPLILIFLREPLSKKLRGEKKLFEGGFGSFFVDNFFEMFEVLLSYVTNTMSFLRVGAFVLVHAGMMEVVFVMAGMFGPVGSTITIILGNVLVMALEALLVGIQVLRLEYYEMFSRFYIGDGRKYEPVNVKNLTD
ncbi:V-type ATP synthase subunit I [Ruminococcus sp.]|uniref:V-type ATP synthase subunit I n=1 Tax=Ruminococcus sp. TaxID=41978 RepID=UPI002E80190D|nr:V-type ATPase 116kDa subunit family protein [Ruminococcus sp.]MEE3493172.1 V-type ATPase 116kDa subunit family protein [Ruminococcus sp.]